MTQNDGSPAGRAKRATPDEGEAYTRAVMAEVARLRKAEGRKWSAERLAEEMAKAGIPWTRDTVTNLESGRRKRIAAHEVLALAWVLELPSPVDLLAPPGDRYVQVLPGRREYTAVVRAWFEGKTGPLRLRQPWSPEVVAAAADELAGEMGADMGLSPEAVRQMIEYTRTRRDQGQEGGS